jgi:ACS family pantothenate transporter-like MFS transporter
LWHADKAFSLVVFWTASIQLLLWRDRKAAARAASEESSPEDQESGSPPLRGSDVDEKTPVDIKEARL